MLEPAAKNWRAKIHGVVYESNTFAGKAFDVSLLVFILASILVVMLDSVDRFHARYGDIFLALEWAFTILFTISYVMSYTIFYSIFYTIFYTISYTIFYAI